MTSVPAPPKASAPAHWIYVDEARTHEVHAQAARRGARNALVTTEFPFGSRDASEMLQLELPFDEPWELKLQLAELELRLALAGRYWRGEPGGAKWQPVPRREPATPVNLRAHEVPLPGDKTGKGRMGFHHFHDSTEGKDRFLVTMPRLDVPGGRFVLADLAFQFPKVDEGRLDIVHTRLAPGLLQSSLVREHLELPKRGFSKLVEARDYAAAYGRGWADKVKESFQAATKRLLLGQTGPGKPPAPKPEGPPPVLTVELARAFKNPVVGDTYRQYVTETDEKGLAKDGELGIRRWVAQRRRRADHGEQLRLSLLEAYLLARYGIRAGRRDLVEQEGAKLLRYVNGYS